MTSGTDLVAGLEHNEVTSALGLRVDTSVDISMLATITGPFVTADIANADGSSLSACVAVRDAMTSESEDLLQSLVTSTTGQQTLTPGAPVATGAEIERRFTGPIEMVALSDGTEVQAFIVSAIERRANPLDDPEPQPVRTPVGEPMALGGGFDKLVNVALDVSVELGRTLVTLAEVLDYDVGSVIELDRAAGAPVDVRVNGMLLAQGEVVLIDDEYAVRITAIIDPPADG